FRLQHWQVKAIQEMYQRWLSCSSVWSQACEKVHEAQLEHVQKGCLMRTKTSIKADSGHIKRSH
ncbi:uncharacterized protein EI90DRAFT_2861803, partial [Cantharellus anzutake]|uniref:uncharacterized protein n=1 Tax=Cantharellus anzutake TaxID=1750568 RepID=UPI0019045E9C